jgi:signal transduction histidine kinase
MDFASEQCFTEHVAGSPFGGFLYRNAGRGMSMNDFVSRPISVRHAPKLRALFTSIKGQIFIIFATTFLSLSALTILNVISLDTVKTRLLLSERYDDLLNNILEVRRFEKNYLFYKDSDSLHEGIGYLQRINGLIPELSDDIIQVTNRRSFDSFMDNLRAYDQTMRTLDSAHGSVPDEEEIRLRGKSLVDFAEQLRATKRDRIHSTIFHTSVLPFVFLGVLGLFMMVIIKLISFGLLRPLSVLQSTIQRVARGDYSPIPYEGLRTEEISGLIGAVNRMARELEANQEDLLQARKIAALGTFTAGIAHELNNPINNISLTAETLLEEYPGCFGAEGRDMIIEILSQADRAGDIVKNLLDFSRTERPAFSALSVQEMIQSTVSLIKNQVMLAGIRLNLEIPRELPRIRGNLRNLQQVFMNLLLNSIQAMSGEGEITIRGMETPPDFIRIDVLDTGKGIDPETVQQIFEPFFTTKEVGRGTGLGLAVVYSIINRHGGRIEVRSELGKGSAFSVFLPEAIEDQAQ